VDSEAGRIRCQARARYVPGTEEKPIELIVRRSKREESQIVRAGKGRWSPGIEADFLAWLAAGFGVSHAARQIGFSTNALYQRRLRDPDFAARWAKVREEGLARSDELLIDSVPRTLDPEVIAAAAEDLPRPTIAEAIQIQRLYRPRVGPGGGRDRDPSPERAGEEELNESIMALLDVLERRQAGERLAAGWTRDGERHWIPPGWVRKDEAAWGAAGAGRTEGARMPAALPLVIRTPHPI
jgi:hypothetical protein